MLASAATTFSVRLLVVATFGVASASGCVPTRTPQPAASGVARTNRADQSEHAAHAQSDEHQPMMGMCPMKVPGTVAAVTDTKDGVAISFTTSAGDIAELRRRVHHMAQMHDRHADMMGGRQGTTTERPATSAPGPMGSQKKMMVPSTATAEDIEGGARIVLVPKDPANLAELRQHARDHVAMMSRGECPMMAMRAHPSPGGR